MSTEPIKEHLTKTAVNTSKESIKLSLPFFIIQIVLLVMAVATNGYNSLWPALLTLANNLIGGACGIAVLIMAGKNLANLSELKRHKVDTALINEIKLRSILSILMGTSVLLSYPIILGVMHLLIAMGL